MSQSTDPMTPQYHAYLGKKNEFVNTRFVTLLPIPPHLAYVAPSSFYSIEMDALSTPHPPVRHLFTATGGTSTSVADRLTPPYATVVLSESSEYNIIVMPARMEEMLRF